MTAIGQFCYTYHGPNVSGMVPGMAVAASVISKAADQINNKLKKVGDYASEDTRQEIALFLCRNRGMVNEYLNGNWQYVFVSASNMLKDKGYGRERKTSHIDVPRMDQRDTLRTRDAKLTALRNQVSINDELDGDPVETILPCGRYDQAEVWRKVRSDQVFLWIENNAPLLDYLLETNKKEVPAPSAWNSTPTIRAFMGTDEVAKLLRKFGQSLSEDEKLHIKQEMFQRFLRQKNAAMVRDEDLTSDSDFFMAM